MKSLLKTIFGIGTIEDFSKSRATAQTQEEAEKLTAFLEKVEAYRLELRQMANKPKSKRKAKMLKVCDTVYPIRDKDKLRQLITEISGNFNIFTSYRKRKKSIVARYGNGKPEEFFIFRVELSSKELGCFVTRPGSKEVFFIFYDEKNKKDNWFTIIE